MSSAINQVIRGYELRELIGTGGFGAVYQAYQAIVRREVAIKIILPQYANHPDFILRFEAEAQLVARLEHIHIVPLYDYWREPNGAFLVMRWLHGGSLRGKLRQGPLKPPETARLLDQIASALTAAHRRGVIHRDLKPDNILLDEDGNAYLADFGIAKDLGNTVPDLSQPESIVGSPAYLSPEQIIGDLVTPRTDIYSLGVMLFELLTGETPFPKLPATELIQIHLHEPLPSVLIRRPHLPAGLDTVIQKATAKNPAQRYQDAASVAAAFRNVLDSSRPQTTEVAVTDVPDTSTPAEIPHAMTTRESQPTDVYEPGTEYEATLTPGASVPVFDSEGLTITPGAAPTTEERTPTLAAIPTVDLENPYKGLRAFQQADADDFFGRAALIAQLVARMAEDGPQARFLAVIGPSGSGKSSVVRAGLLPALRNGALPGSRRWFLVEMTPGTHPMEQLEEALRRVAVNPIEDLSARLHEDERGLLRAVNQMLPGEGRGELVLVIDQFEEVFSSLDDEGERAHLLKSLLIAATDPGSHLRVVITLRADFYDRPLLYPDFGNLVRQRTEVVLPLNADELQQAIAGPAQRIGAELEPSLVEAIVADVGEQPGALPLLQYALTELFERREGRMMKLAAYHGSGGVLGALARRADELYDSLDAKGREAARQMLLRLVNIGEGSEDTRRRIHTTDLIPADGNRQTMDAVVDAFSKYRLLTFDRDPQTRAPTVEIAHEALIRTWKRLKDWLTESREDLLVQRRLSAAVAEWLASGRDASFLATGTRLDQFEGWAAGTTLVLNEDERTYLNASIVERNTRLAAEEASKAHEAMLERRSRNRLRVLAVVLFIATLGAFGLTTIALNQQQLAINNASTATIAQGQAIGNASTAIANANTATVAQGLAVNNASTATIAQGQAIGNANTAIANANTATVAQGLAIANAATAQSNFIRAESQRLAAEAVNLMQAKDGNTEVAGLLSVRAMKLAYSPQADQALARATTLDYAVRSFQHGNKMTAVAFSPNGQYVLTAGFSNVAHLWDAQTGKEIRSFTTASVVPNLSMIWTAAFTPDGRYLLTSASRMQLWDVQTGEEVRRFTDDTMPQGVAFSPDGRYLLSGRAKNAVLWDVQSGIELRQFEGHQDAVDAVAFSPDGQYVLTGSDDKTARVWNVQTGELIRTFTDPLSRVAAVAFSPDGKWVLVGGSSTRLWNAQTGEKYRDFTGSVTSAAFSPDGKTVLAAGGLKSAQLWNVETGQEMRELTGHTQVVASVAFSPDGRLALTGSDDGTARLWNIQQTNAQARILTGHTSSVDAVDFSPDGRYILTGSADKSARLWDAVTGQEVLQFIGHTNYVLCAKFSPDGRYVLTAGTDKTARLWDARTAKEIRQFIGHTDEIRAAVFSPDGRYILTGSLDRTARLWDTQTGQPVRQLRANGGEVLDAAFSPDGRRAVIGNANGTVQIFDVETGVEIRHMPGGDSVGLVQGMVVGVAFSPDGRYVLTGSYDKTARLFNAETGQEIRRFTGHTEGLIAVAFSPDSKTAITTSVDTTARLWDVQTGRELRRFAGHTQQVTGVAFSRDGKHVVTSSRDQTARVWDVDYHASMTFVCSHLFRDLTDAERAQYGIADTSVTCSGLAAPPVQVQPTWTPVPLSTGVAMIEPVSRPRRFEGHNGGVASVAFSPDGRFLLSSSYDGAVFLWDIQTGQRIRRFEGHTEAVLRAAFSPDGRYVLTASEDKTARLWDAQTGQEIRRFAGDLGQLSSVAFSPDGKHAVGAGTDRIVHLWDVQTGNEERRFVGHVGRVSSVAFSPDGRYVLTGSDDQTARLWDARSGQELRMFVGHHRAILSVAFSPDGKVIATGGGAATESGGGDTIVRLWDVQTGTVLHQLIGHRNPVNGVAFSPDGRFLLTGSSDNTIRLWSVQEGTELRRFSSPTESAELITSIAFAPDGHAVAGGTFSSKLALVWDIHLDEALEGPVKLLTPTATPTPSVSPVALHPRTFTSHTGAVYKVAFSPDGRYILTNGKDAILRLLDAQTGIEQAQYKSISAAFSPDGKTILLGGLQPVLRDIETGAGLRAFAGVQNGTFSVTFSPDGHYVLSGDLDNVLRMYDSQTGKLVREFAGHTKPIWNEALSPDDQSILTVGLDDTVRLWDANTGKQIDVFTGTGGLGAAFSPDGKLIAIAGTHPQVMPFGDKKNSTPLLGHTGATAIVVFSPDGKVILTTGEDNTVRLWDVQSGKELRRFTTNDLILSAAFSPDGKFVLTGSNDGSVQLWDADTSQSGTASPTLASAIAITLSPTPTR